MGSIEAKEKFVEWLLSEIPTTKTDYRVYEAWLWFRKVASYYLSWQEAMKQLQVMRAKYNGLEKTKKWNRRFFIKRFGFIKGEYWYLLAKRPRKRLETEETEKWREEFKNLSLKDSVEINVPENLKQFKKDLVAMHNLG